MSKSEHEVVVEALRECSEPLDLHDDEWWALRSLAVHITPKVAKRLKALLK